METALQFVVVTSADDLEKVLKRYRVWLKTRVADSTQEKYNSHLESLRDWLAQRGVYTLEGLTRLLLEEWVAELHDKWAASTVKQAVAAVRSFVNFLEDVRLVRKKQRKKLLKALPLPKVKKNEQRTLSMGEILAMLAVCDLAKPKGARDAALIGLLIDSGLRAAEIRRLKLDDVEFQVQITPEVVVNRLTVVIKGNERRAGYFSERTAAHLSAWLKVRDKVAAPGVEEIFVSAGGITRGQKLSEDGLKVILRKLGDQAGVKHCSPHAFRRGFACLLMLAGANHRTIMELGRWDDLEMVILYTRAFQAALAYNSVAPMDYMARGPQVRT